MGRFIFTQKEMDYIRDNIETQHYKKIAKVISGWRGFELTARQISGKANNMGLKQSKPKEYDRHFFNKIDNQEKGYWLGFIYADGWVTRSECSAELGIELAVIDKQHLHKFKKVLKDKETEVLTSFKPETTIKTTGQLVSSRETSRVRFYSMDIVDDLISHGVVLRKTYSEISPDFTYDEEINLAIIRGYFDGDGGIDLNGQIKFTAYRVEFLLKLQKYLKDVYGVEGRVFKETRSDGVTFVHRFTIHNSSTEKFLNILYKDLSYSYLDRKYKKFIQHYIT